MAEDRTVYKFEGDASGLIRAVKKASGAMDVAKKEAKKLDDELENVEHQAEKTAAGEVVLAGASLTAAGGMSALAAAASVAVLAAFGVDDFDIGRGFDMAGDLFDATVADQHIGFAALAFVDEAGVRNQVIGHASARYEFAPSLVVRGAT